MTLYLGNDPTIYYSSDHDGCNRMAIETVPVPQKLLGTGKLRMKLFAVGFTFSSVVMTPQITHQVVHSTNWSTILGKGPITNHFNSLSPKSL